jgi:hypothetical protein
MLEFGARVYIVRIMNGGICRKHYPTKSPVVGILFPFFLVGLVLIRVSDLQRPAAPVLAWGPGVAHLIPQLFLSQACLLH